MFIEKHSSKNLFSSGFGFKLPYEHGLTMIWLGSVILGVFLSLLRSTLPQTLLLMLLFAITVLFSADSFLEMIRSRFKKLYPLPLVLVGFLGFINYMLFFTLYAAIVWGMLVVSSIIWSLLTLKKTKAQSTTELTVGAFVLSILSLLIPVVSAAPVSFNDFISMTLIWWLFAGFSCVLILHVDSLRERISTTIPFVVWLSFFLIFVVAFVIYQNLSPLIMIAGIEPTLHSFRQALRKESLRISKRSLKAVGREQTLRLFLFVVLILLFH